MYLFLDTIDLDFIRANKHIINGVTTNPSLIAKYDGTSNVKYVIKEICDIVDHVSIEVTAEDNESMVKEAMQLSKISQSNVVVKLPMTENGLSACNKIRNLGIRTNITLCFSLAQALLAARAGATFVSPFVGRLDDCGSSGISLIRQIRETFKLYSISTGIIAASIRSVRDVILSASVGADIATIPPQVFKKMFVHPLTNIGLEQFMSDFQNSKNSIIDNE